MASKALQEILRLNPATGYERIYYLSHNYEFPWDITRALEMALFRTYAVPSVSALLDQTGEFQLRALKRYDDTDLILSEILEHGFESERGRAALRRMNQMHGRFPISNDDFLYVLSTFVYEPIRWNRRFGWRQFVEQERLALFYYYRELGRRMNVKSLPDDTDKFEQFSTEYERRNFRFSESNQRVANATRDMFLAKVLPAPLIALGRPGLYAILDEPLIEAFGFPKPSRWMRGFVGGALKLRARAVALLPPRKRPHFRTQLRRRTYPQGYEIQQLGTFDPPSRSGTPRS